MSDKEAFEAWARKTPRYPVANPDFNHLGESDKYSNDWVQADWEVWQAATITERERCAQVCDAVVRRQSYGHAKSAAGDCADFIRSGE